MDKEQFKHYEGIFNRRNFPTIQEFLEEAARQADCDYTTVVAIGLANQDGIFSNVFLTNLGLGESTREENKRDYIAFRVATIQDKKFQALAENHSTRKTFWRVQEAYEGPLAITLKRHSHSGERRIFLVYQEKFTPVKDLPSEAAMGSIEDEPEPTEEELASFDHLEETCRKMFMEGGKYKEE